MYTLSSPQSPFMRILSFCISKRVDILGILKFCKIFYSFPFSIPDPKKKLWKTLLTEGSMVAFLISLDIQESNSANDLKLN